MTLPLDPRYPDCTLDAYLHRQEERWAPRPAILICPGGAYQFLSDREAAPVAAAYVGAGLQAFVLRYSVGENAQHDAPLIEVALAIKHLREHATDYDIDPTQVFVTGFSAGGHLAAMSGTLWNDPVVRDALGIGPDIPADIAKPTATLLCYPVISAHAPGWSQSIATLCGIDDYKGRPEADHYSLERHVSADTAPSFLWHTFDDDGVDIRHPLLYMEALTAAGVPFECHIYPHGPHGLSLATAETSGGNPAFERPNVAAWFPAALRYIGGFTAL